MEALKTCTTVATSNVERAIAQLETDLKSKKTVDDARLDALWQCLTVVQPSKTIPHALAERIHNVAFDVHHPGYATRAHELFKASGMNARPDDGSPPHDLFPQRLTAIRIAGDLKYAPAIPDLVSLAMKNDIATTDYFADIRIALLLQPSAAEKELLIAWRAKTAGVDTQGIHSLLQLMADNGRPALRDVAIAAIAKASSPAERAIIAMSLAQFPKTPQAVAAFREALTKTPPGTSYAISTPRTTVMGNARSQMLELGHRFYDPSLTPWILQQAKPPRGDTNAQQEVTAEAYGAVYSACLLMTAAQAKTTLAAIPELHVRGELPKDCSAASQKLVERCGADPRCYEKEVLDRAAGESPSRPDKAVVMAAVFADASTPRMLIDAIPKGTFDLRMQIAHALYALAAVGKGIDATTAAQLESATFSFDPKRPRVTGGRSLVDQQEVADLLIAAARMRSRTAP